MHTDVVQLHIGIALGVVALAARAAEREHRPRRSASPVPLNRVSLVRPSRPAPPRAAPRGAGRRPAPRRRALVRARDHRDRGAPRQVARASAPRNRARAPARARGRARPRADRSPGPTPLRPGARLRRTGTQRFGINGQLAHGESLGFLGTALVSCAARLAIVGPSSRTARKRLIWVAMTKGTSTDVPAAMIAIESAPPGLVAK
jgi:hypothetical protein